MTKLRHISQAALAATALFAGAQGAVSCAIPDYVLTDAELREQRRSEREQSLRVEQGANCAFKNGKLDDTLGAGPAFDLGSGLVAQVLTHNGAISRNSMVADCSKREVVRIVMRKVPESEAVKNDVVLDSCGRPHYPETWRYRYNAVFAPDGPIDASEHNSLLSVKVAARDLDMGVDERMQQFLFDKFDQPYRSKERIDLLCGCKVFYPDSAGAH